MSSANSRPSCSEPSEPAHSLRRFIIALLGAAAIVVLAIWIAYGFWTPDPQVQLKAAGPRGLAVLWGGRIGVPLVGLLGAALLVAVGRARVHAGVLGLAVGGFYVTLFPVYVLGDVLYDQSFRQGRDQLHPFLQLTPTPYQRGASKVLRVFCLGGSTTEFVDESGRGWPDRVQEALRAMGYPVEVSNLGRQWYSTVHSLSNYVVNLRQHRPDVIIVMHAINDLLINADFSHLSQGTYRSDYGHFLGPITRVVKRRSFGASTVKLAQELSSSPAPKAIDAPRLPGLGDFKRRLETLIDIAELDGVHVVLMTQPTLLREQMPRGEIEVLNMVNFEAVGPRQRWTHRAAARGMTAFNQAIREVAQRRRVTLIDLAAQIPGTPEHFLDEVHYTKAGYLRVTQRVVEGLRRSGVLLEPPSTAAKFSPGLD